MKELFQGIVAVLVAGSVIAAFFMGKVDASVFVGLASAALTWLFSQQQTMTVMKEIFNKISNKE